MWNLSIGLVLDSVGLALFGVILTVRGGIRFARVSSVLGIFLAVSYLSVIFGFSVI